MRSPAPLGLLALAACAAPPVDEMRNHVQMQIVDGAPAADARFVAAVDAAQREVRAALPSLADPTVAQALARAAGRGVDVEVVTDAQQADDLGLAVLLDAGVPVALADDGVTYTEFSFASPTEVSFSGDLIQMTHAFVVVDGTRIVAASAAGDGAAGARVLFEIESEDLGEDLRIEHNQLTGGTDASAQTAFNSMAKSIADSRWMYGNQTGLGLELWLGPQERVIKRMIDSVYTARASVYLLTDDFLDQGFARALQDKAQDGFDVQVIVGPRFRSGSRSLSEELARYTPDVRKRQVPEGALPEGARVPTILLIDTYPSANPTFGDTGAAARAFVPTIPVLSATRFIGTEPVPSDQFADAHLWVLTDWAHDPDAPSPEIGALFDVLKQHLDVAGPLQ
jgi:phosphatidylserine/phosphatidylglycerophosphate/cardiolipin synthase-like enzyme